MSDLRDHTKDELVEIFTDALVEYAGTDADDDREIWREAAEVVTDVMQQRGWI